MIISSLKRDKDVTTNFYSSEFPINLNGLESSKEMLLFCLEDEIESENILLEITTSRGILEKNINYKSG